MPDTDVLPKIQLRADQLDLHSKVLDSYRSGHKAPLVVAPCGFGKTVFFCYIASRVIQKGKRVIIQVHRQELIDQISRTLHLFDVPHSYIAPGYYYDARSQVQVASVMSLIGRLNRVEEPDLVITDECFVAGTTVNGVAIESLRPGDYVTGWDEAGQRPVTSKVLSVSRRHSPPALYRITSGVHSVVTTETHPFLTPDGWKKAGSLQKGDSVYGLRYMWRTEENKKSEEMSPVLLQESSGSQERGHFPGANEEQEPDATGFGKGGDGSNFKGDRTQTENSGWQWEAASSSSQNIDGRSRMGYGSRRGRHSNRVRSWRKRLSESLQAGPRGSLRPFRSRGRRSVALGSSQESARQEERGFLEVARVDNIEVLERGSDGEYKRVCPDGFVYNLEVEGVHTYTANGFVVHNCHHATRKSSWGKVLNAFPRALRLGVTATPTRLSGEPLGDLFDDLVLGPTVRELIDAGLLSDYKLVAPPLVETEALHMRGGDYQKEELSELMDKPRITGSAVAEYTKYAHGKRAVAFCVSVEHAQHVAAEFRHAGYAAQSIDGGMDKIARKVLVDRFREGDLQIVTSCDLLNEGFDLPAIEAGIFLRPTASTVLAIQQPGRCLRAMPGKKAAILIDHVQNWKRHGLIDDERDWTLSGRTKKERKREESDSTKICPSCFLVQKRTAPVCTECQHVFETTPREIEAVEGALTEMDLERLRQTRKMEQGMAQDLQALIAVGKARHMRNPVAWANIVLKARHDKLEKAEARKNKQAAINDDWLRF